MMSKEEVHQVMMDMSIYYRYRWCGGGPCGCMGCANGSGLAASKGVTKEQWEEWVASNPEPPNNYWMPNDERTSAPTLADRLAVYKTRNAEADLAVALDVLWNRTPADDRDEV